MSRAKGAKASAARDARLVERTSALHVRKDGTLRIAVVADTHSAPHPSLHEHLRGANLDAVFHAGDIGSLTVLDDLAKIAPLFAVRGNIDVHAAEVPDIHVVEIRDAGGDTTLLTILLLHIALDGPRLRAGARRLSEEKRADLVVCGHSHVPFVGRDRATPVFNPGSAGPRRFRLPILFGSIQIDREGVSLRHIDCETGNPWMPRGASGSGCAPQTS